MVAPWGRHVNGALGKQGSTALVGRGKSMGSAGKAHEIDGYLLGAVIDVVHANANNLLGVVQWGKELDVGARDLRSTSGGAESIAHHNFDQVGKRVRESKRKRSTVTPFEGVG